MKCTPTVLLDAPREETASRSSVMGTSHSTGRRISASAGGNAQACDHHRIDDLDSSVQILENDVLGATGPTKRKSG